MRNLLRVVLILALVVAPLARAAELAGVRFEDQLQLGDTMLPLNGLGLRKVAFFKVYVAGLYLPKAARAEAEVVAPDVPKALILQFLRDVDRSRLTEAFREGFAKNTPAPTPALQASIDRFLGLLPDVKDGDRIVFSYYPERGAMLRVPGGSEVFPGKAFADAYLRVFVGDKPPTEALKHGLLGRR